MTLIFGTLCMLIPNLPNWVGIVICLAILSFNAIAVIKANHFRRNNEFDKAMGIYEKILNEDNTDAEAYWSLVLCRYGIEYVEDPTTHKRIPTVNRAQFTSVFDDDNYKSALQYADSYQKSIYEEEAKMINEIQRVFLRFLKKKSLLMCLSVTKKPITTVAVHPTRFSQMICTTN